MPSTDVNGVSLHYESRGHGDLVLFLHGFPEFWWMWRRQLDDIGSDRSAVAVDMRGYNLSSRPHEVEDYALAVLVEDVRQLVAALGHGRCTLVGHDWGGLVAWCVAMAHPELLDRLVIVNMPHPACFVRELRTNPAQQRASAYMTLFRSTAAEPTLSANGYAGLAATIGVSESDRPAYVEAWQRQGGLTGGLNYYRAAKIGPPSDGADVLDARLVPFVARAVRVPTLVVWGMRDTALLPSCLEGTGQYVPDLTVRRVDDASHWIVREQPDLVSRHIRDFLG